MSWLRNRKSMSGPFALLIRIKQYRTHSPIFLYMEIVIFVAVMMTTF
jgi:hypothetical protein